MNEAEKVLISTAITLIVVFFIVIKIITWFQDKNQKKDLPKKTPTWSKKLFQQEQPSTHPEKSYEKKALLTPTEIKFQNAIEKALPGDYILYPQINLASIIKRTDEHKFQNELYRNVDFCIFDKKFNPVLVIEINDKTHNEKERKARDYKVKDICQKANLPIFTLWTDYGVNESYIQKKINEFLN